MQELLKWIGALAVLISFALTMGSNPSLYGATVDMLARRTRWLPRLIWMMVGFAFGATVLYTLFRFIDPDSFVHELRGGVDRAVRGVGIDLVAGALFLAAAVAVIVWRVRVRALPTRTEKAPKPNARPASYFIIGLSSSVIGFTTLPIMYLTGRVIAGLTDDYVVRLLAFAFFLAALVAPYFTLAWAWVRLPSVSNKISALYGRVLHWDYRWALAAFLAAAGLVCIGLAAFEHR